MSKQLCITSRSLVFGFLAAPVILLSSCGPLGGELGGGNHQVVNAPGLKDLGSRLREAANSYRRSNGKSTLTNHAGLQELAQQHSEAMARSGTLSHAGSSTRSDIASSKYQIRATAENVMRWPVSGGRDPQKMLQTWIDSSGHRRNMLDGSYRVTGLGIAQNEEGNIWVTQMFGWPPGAGAIAPGTGSAW